MMLLTSCTDIGDNAVTIQVSNVRSVVLAVIPIYAKNVLLVYIKITIYQGFRRQSQGKQVLTLTSYDFYIHMHIVYRSIAFLV